MKHPSLKNIVLIIIAAIIVGVAFFVAEYRNKQSQNMIYSAVALSTTDAISSDAQNIDSDHDGLKDWEEVLLGTDPHNPDTDGDGTPDGEEVKLGRNPLVKGPNDKMSATDSSSAISDEQLSPTDKLARDFFARYMELHQAGLDTDEQSQDDLVQQVLASGMVLEIPKTYTVKDIIVTKNVDVASVKKYGDDTAWIFQNLSIKSRNEAIITKDSLDKGDPSILKEIDPIIASYKSILNALLKEKIPQNMTDVHLGLINAMSKVLFVAEMLRKSDIDAFSGAIGVAKYQDSAQSIHDALLSVRDYFVNNRITFDPTENGIFFMNMK